MEPRRCGRYELRERLGRGGMGEVWRARDPALHRDVAVKMLRRKGEADTISDEFARRFLREARLAASLKHPNVVAVHDVGVDEEPYIVMEYVDGASLRSFIGTKEPPVAQRMAWLVEIAQALAAAHAIGLVHRDIKPENVMIAKDGHAKVLDFGIAKTMGSRDEAPVSLREAPDSFRTQQGRVIGTPKYMAPEQLDGLEVDARVDQWAWACVAYELLTGKMPDRDETALPISLSQPEVPFDFAAAVVRARSRDPAQRFDSMKELVAMLAPATSPENVSLATIPARRAPDEATAARRARRSRWPIVLVALASFSLSAGAVMLRARHSPKPAPPAPTTPTCTLSTLAPVPLGSLELSRIVDARAYSGGILLLVLDSDSTERIVTITEDAVTTRVAAPPPFTRKAALRSAFLVAEPEHVVHWEVYDPATPGPPLLLERELANGRVRSSMSWLSGNVVSIAGVLGPETSPPEAGFIALTEEGLRFYGEGTTAEGAVFFTAAPGEEVHLLGAASGARSIAYALRSGTKLRVGSFSPVVRVQKGMFGTSVEHLDLGEPQSPVTLGESLETAMSFEDDRLHVVWPELGHPRLHHTVLATAADAGAPEDEVLATVSAIHPQIAIDAGVFSLAWNDGARLHFGQGASLSDATRRAAVLSDSTVSAGPWIHPGPHGALVAWISGEQNELRRAIAACP